MREVKASSESKSNAHGRSVIGLISPSKERTLTAKSSPATERVEETPSRRKKGGKTPLLSPYSQSDYWNIPEHRILSFGDGNVIDLDEPEETLKPW